MAGRGPMRQEGPQKAQRGTFCLMCIFVLQLCICGTICCDLRRPSGSEALDDPVAEGAGVVFNGSFVQG